MAENRLAGVLLPLAVDSSAWNAGLGRAQRSLNTFAGGLRIAGFRLALITAPLIAASGAILKFSTDFESAMTGVRKTVNPTVKQFDLLNRGLLQMSKIIPLPATELARITQLAGQFGINTENLLDFTEALAKLSIAAEDLPTEEAARQLARFIELTDAGQKDVTKLASIIARLGDNLATDEGRILNFGVRIAAAGTVTKLAADEILGIAGAFSALVSGVERASTAVQRSFFVMKQAAGDGGKALELFAFVATQTGKITREEFAKALKEDADKAFIAFVEGIAAIEQAGGNAVALMKQMGLGNLRTAQSFLSAAVGVGTFQKALALASDESKIFSGEVEGTSKLEQEFSNRLQDTTARLALLGNHIKAAAVILGGSFLPLIKNAITFVIGLVGTLEQLAIKFAALPDATKSTVLQFGALLFIAGPLLIALGTIIATVVALSSILVPLGVVIIAVVKGWELLTGRSLDLGDALIILFELSVGVIEAWGDLSRTAMSLAVSILQLSKSLVDASIVLGKLQGLTTTVEEEMSKNFAKAIRDVEQAMFKSNVESGKFRENIDKMRLQVESLAGRLKQGTEGFGDFEAIIEKASEELDKIKAELAATADSAKKAGEKIEGMGASTEFTNEKVSIFDTTLKSLTASFNELGGVDVVARFAALSTAIANILKKTGNKITEPLGKAFLKELQNIIETGAFDSATLNNALELGNKLGGKIAEGVRDTLLENLMRIGPDVLVPLKSALTSAQVKGIFKFLDEGGPKLGKVKKDVEEVAKETKKWDNLLQDVANTFRILGISASSTLGRILGGITVAFEAGRNLKKVFFDIAKDGTETFKGFGQAIKDDFFGVIIGGLQAVGSLIAATGEGGLQGIIGGGLAGAQLGAQIGGPIGAAVGAAIGVGIALVRGKPEYKKAVDDVARDFGTAISDELGKAIVETMKKLDLGRFEASLLHFTDILAEAGGLSAANMEQFVARFNDLINAVALGTVPLTEGMEALEKGFASLAEGLETMGVTGAVQIGALINRFKELGLEVAGVSEFIREKAESAISSLSVFFDFLLEKEKLTTAEATAAVTQLAGAFAAALKATGSLFEAFQMLPENFGEILGKLREVLGGENQVLNAIGRYYRFTKNNEEVLAAIGALGNAFMDLLAIGIVTEANILDFAASFKTSFNELINSTENEKLALISIGPQIGMLLEAFRELGLKPPAWLRALAVEAEKAGASLEPPEGLPDILADIRDILADIAEALGAVSREADSATQSLKNLGNASPNVNIPKVPKGPELIAAQTGFKGIVTQPSLFLAGEGGPESVVIQPVGAAGDIEAIREIEVQVNINGGNFLGSKEEIAETVWSEFAQRIRNNQNSVRTEIVEAARRG